MAVCCFGSVNVYSTPVTKILTNKIMPAGVNVICAALSLLFAFTRGPLHTIVWTFVLKGDLQFVKYR